jgi:hypothetical protein
MTLGGNVLHEYYSSRDQTVRFAYVTSLRMKGKRTHVPCKPKTLPTYEVAQRAEKYCHWEIMFVVWTECASLSATPSNSLIHLPCTYNGYGTHRFALATVPWV